MIIPCGGNRIVPSVVGYDKNGKVIIGKYVRVCLCVYICVCFFVSIFTSVVIMDYFYFLLR